jgi:SAM-dependent methyltransferase
MNLKITFYPESKFGGFSDIDGIINFYIRVNSLIETSSIVLDLGCGRGALADDKIPLRKNLRILKGKCQKVIGIDVDEFARMNPFIDEFLLIEGNYFPLPRHHIDIIVCDSVLEHVEDPELFFSECHRVLKPEGYLCLKTGNVFSYPGICAKLIPNKYHTAILKKIQGDRKEGTIFHVFNRCNTIKKIRNMLSKYGFDHYVYGYEAEPSYLYFSKLLYWLGTIHQKYAPMIIKPAIFAYARKLS